MSVEGQPHRRREQIQPGDTLIQATHLPLLVPLVTGRRIPLGRNRRATPAVLADAVVERFWGVIQNSQNPPSETRTAAIRDQIGYTPEEADAYGQRLRAALDELRDLGGRSQVWITVGIPDVIAKAAVEGKFTGRRYVDDPDGRRDRFAIEQEAANLFFEHAQRRGNVTALRGHIKPPDGSSVEVTCYRTTWGVVKDVLRSKKWRIATGKF